MGACEVPDYRRMYYTLCAGVSALLDDIQADGAYQSIYRRLELLLQEAEDIYIETAGIIRLEDRLPGDKTKNE